MNEQHLSHVLAKKSEATNDDTDDIARTGIDSFGTTVVVSDKFILRQRSANLIDACGMPHGCSVWYWEDFNITFRQAAAVWWPVFWRMVILGLGTGFVVGLIEGAVGALVGMPSTATRVLTAASGFILGLLLGIYAVKLGLRKRYRGFTICLIPSQK
jgi:hypothetical protein